MKIINRLFTYKNLKIIQDTNIFSFSLESVLLPHFVHITKKTKRILDIGTGNGLIPLVLSTKTNIEIVGVEINPVAFKLAQENIILNKKRDQIKVINIDIKKYQFVPSKKFDLVVCNPPFFSIGGSYQQEHKNYQKKIARHETLLTLNDLLAKVKQIINFRGYLVMCYRADRLSDLMFSLSKHHFIPKRIQFIHSKINTPALTFLVETRYYGGRGLVVEKPIVVHNLNNSFKTKVSKLFKD